MTALRALRVLLGLHGLLGGLTLALLLHPAILLRRGRPLTRGHRWALALTMLVTTLTFGLGSFIYGDYRARVKRAVFEAAPAAGWLFETKEHLAFAVITMTLGAGAAAMLAPRAATAQRQAAAAVFAAAALLALVVVASGITVTSLRSF